MTWNKGLLIFNILEATGDYTKKELLDFLSFKQLSMNEDREINLINIIKDMKLECYFSTNYFQYDYKLLTIFNTQFCIKIHDTYMRLIEASYKYNAKKQIDTIFLQFTYVSLQTGPIRAFLWRLSVLYMTLGDLHHRFGDRLVTRHPPRATLPPLVVYLCILKTRYWNTISSRS